MGETQILPPPGGEDPGRVGGCFWTCRPGLPSPALAWEPTEQQPPSGRGWVIHVLSIWALCPRCSQGVLWLVGSPRDGRKHCPWSPGTLELLLAWERRAPGWAPLQPRVLWVAEGPPALPPGWEGGGDIPVPSQKQEALRWSRKNPDRRGWLVPGVMTVLGCWRGSWKDGFPPAEILWRPPEQGALQRGHPCLPPLSKSGTCPESFPKTWGPVCRCEASRAGLSWADPSLPALESRKVGVVPSVPPR